MPLCGDNAQLMLGIIVSAALEIKQIKCQVTHCVI